MRRERITIDIEGGGDGPSFDSLHKWIRAARQGDVEAGYALIDAALDGLRNGRLPPRLAIYLMRALRDALDLQSADAAFNIKRRRGQPTDPEAHAGLAALDQLLERAGEPAERRVRLIWEIAGQIRDRTFVQRLRAKYEGMRLVDVSALRDLVAAELGEGVLQEMDRILEADGESAPA